MHLPASLLLSCIVYNMINLSTRTYNSKEDSMLDIKMKTTYFSTKAVMRVHYYELWKLTSFCRKACNSPA